MKFEDIQGQEALKEHFKSAIRLGKVSHAYIINGERGFGRKALAEAFAQALLCEKLNSDHDENQISFPGIEAKKPKPEVIEPCEECVSCKKARHHNHPDIIYISHEKPNIISADEIRTELVDTVDIIPYESKRKIYIIEDGELINETGQNILLKTIEDPPDYITIILLTTNVDKLLPTVLSRCVCLNTVPVSKAEIRAHLMDNGVVDYQADMAVSFAKGNPGRALSIANDVYFQERCKTVCNIIRDINHYHVREISNLAARIEEDKENMGEYMELLMMLLRDAVVFKTTGDEGRLLFAREIRLIREMSKMSLSRLNSLINIVKDTDEKIQAAVTPDLAIEMMLTNMKEIYNT